MITGDTMTIYYDGELCYEIDLTKYGFTAGSKYNVGIIKPAFYNTLFTVNLYELKTGAIADAAIKLLGN